MNLTLQVWRQKSRDAAGAFVTYRAENISPDASFLEMLDVVNERLIEKGEEPIHFEHDCREGICGSCGMMITGAAVEANTIPIPKQVQEQSMDAAECIQCGACVAQCPNGAAQLFTAAKVSHLGLLPQGQPERYERVVKMVEVMESYFGSCTLFRECEAVCPKEIPVTFIARMNRDYLAAKYKSR